MISIYLRPGCRSHPQGALQTVIFTFTYNHNFRTQNEDVSIRGGEALANRRQVIQVVFWRWNERASISFILSAALDRLAELRFGKFARQPIQSLVEAVTLGRACRLDVPLSVPEALQSELVCELTGAHGVWQVLLVGEDEEMRVSQLILLKHLLQLVMRLTDPFTIIGVHNENQSLGVLEVVPPQRTDLVLTANVPHSEADVLVFDSLHVEANGGDRRDDLTQFQLVQNSCLSRGVETHHENSHLFLAKESRKHAGYRQTHGGVVGLEHLLMVVGGEAVSGTLI